MSGEALMAEVEALASKMAAAEGVLRERATRMRAEAVEADVKGWDHRAAALRGKALGLTQGADQFESIRAALTSEPQP